MKPYQPSELTGSDMSKRRHLANVEAELTRTKALLEAAQAGRTLSPMSGISLATVNGRSSPEMRGPAPIQSPQATAGLSIQIPDIGSFNVSLVTHSDSGAPREATANTSPSHSSRSRSLVRSREPDFSLERSSAPGDLEWDEHGNKCDGMANLTDNAKGGGYLGS